MVIMGTRKKMVNTTLFLLLLSIVFIVTTQPVGVQRSTSLPTQLGSGKSKPSRILKPIQFLMVCLKIVHPIAPRNFIIDDHVPINMTIFVYPAVFGGYELPSTRIKVLSKRIAWGWVSFGEHMFGVS